MYHHCLSQEITNPLSILQQLKVNIYLYDTEPELPACVPHFRSAFTKIFLDIECCALILVITLCTLPFFN